MYAFSEDSMADNMAFLLTRQSLTESNVRSYPKRLPIAIAKAKGCILTDMKGQKYLDCLAGAGTLALGHNHPAIIDAIKKVLDGEFPLHTLDLTTPVKQQFIDDVLASLPKYLKDPHVVQFCGPTGADAVEAALKLAKLVTGKSGIFSFQGAYHGMTHGALSITGNLQAKKNIPGLMPNVTFLPYPYAYRCPFGIGETGWQTSLYYLENILNDPESGIEKPAAIILEIIQGEGGVIPAPNEWLQKLRDITYQHNILLIIDEVQTGIGRTGDLYAIESSGIIPDILILSKAIGGSLPLSILVFPKKYDAWQTAQHTGTFRGNQLAMAAGTATFNIFKTQNLLAHTQKMSARLMQHLKTIQEKTDCIGEIRGRGLMLGVEIVNKKIKPNHLNSHPYDSEKAKKIQNHCLKKGLIIEVGGRFSSVLRFLPPLIISPSEIDEVAMIFQHAVEGL